MSAENVNALEVRGLAKNFGGVQAVGGVNFDVKKGELLALIGPNGAGKTTCFNMLNGQLRPNAGSVKFEGRELVGMRPRQVWRLGVGRTFQITQTFQTMTVRENVQMALISHHRQIMRFFRRASSCFVAEADALLDQVGIAEQADRPCGVLAYGDLKRVELAIALANDPKLLLMDEPTAGMAPKERLSLMKLTRQIVLEKGLSVLFTEHDMDIVFGQADRIIVLNRGELVAEGKPLEVRANPLVQQVYLGAGSTFGQEDGDA